jgi:hypothetical protein
MSWRQSVRDAFAFSQQLTRPLRARVVTCALVLSAGCGSNANGIRTADTSVYVRSDTDNTVVIAPRAHVGARFGDAVGIDATYSMDSWTGASVDVVAAATGAIHELRHEVNGALSAEVKNVKLAANYRHSRENDYWSNGGVISLDVELFEKNTTLSFAALGSMDIVGHVDVLAFRKPQDSIGGRVTYTQVLDTKTLLQLSAETLRMAGFMSSPYRYVGVEGFGLCRQTAGLCTPEIHPRERIRNAFSLRLRRAFGSLVSIGVNYRYYFDDWGLDSHTASPDMSILIGDHGTLSLVYRFYMQSRSDFYRQTYPLALGNYRYVTRDRKLSAMMSHHAGLEYRHEVPMGESGDTVLQLGARAGLTRFLYSEFIGLKQVDALEVTGLLGLLFR